MKFTKNIVFYRSQWALWDDYFVFYSVFARPEKSKNDVECGQNLRKT